MFTGCLLVVHWVSIRCLLCVHWVSIWQPIGQTKNPVVFAFFFIYLTTIPVVVGVSTESILLKLKTCSIYHENLLLQKFHEMITQVLN